MTEETESVDKALVEAKSQPTLPLPFIEKWFDNQSQEIKNKQREIDLQKQTDGNNFEYAKWPSTLKRRTPKMIGRTYQNGTQEPDIYRTAGCRHVRILSLLPPYWKGPNCA